MTYQQLLHKLQALTPEQLKQEVWGESECTTYGYQVTVSATRQERFLLDRRYATKAELEELVEEGDATQEEIDSAPLLPKGSLFLMVEEC